VDAVLARQLIPDLPEGMRSPLETCRYSSTFYYQFGLEKQVMPEENDFFVVMIPASHSNVLSFIAKGSRKGEKPIVIAPTRGWEDERLSKLSEPERRALVISEIQRFFPAFPADPPLTKVFRWDRAINLEAPGQFTAIHDLLENHMHDVGGLHLAGEYLFLFACTEGALMTGKQAAVNAIAELEHK
jgi:oxygen-dependent protoporphyrinogen oxidase